MTRSSEKREMDEIAARLTAEDRAVSYLHELPAQTATVVAFRVAWFLATMWEYKQREMLGLGTAGNTIHIDYTDLHELQAMLAMVPPGTPSNAVAEQHINGLLADFPLDKAWWVARKIASWLAFRIKCEGPGPVSAAS